MHQLYMVECRALGAVFTLYPPGYAPYRRQAVLRLAPESDPIRGEGSTVEAEFGCPSGKRI